jgi:hypothetical protein
LPDTRRNAYNNMRNKKYSYIFWATLVLVIAGGIIGGIYVSLSIFFLSFLLILILQLKHGYAFNRGWVLAISRSEHPIQYWVLIVINIFEILGVLIIFYLLSFKK